MSPTLLLVCTLSIVSTSASIVQWLPNSNFKLPENYKDGKLPCSKQTVVFPELVVGSIKIAETEVTGLVLPEEGELILDDILTLGADPTETNCTEGNAYYIDKTTAAWNQADVWSSPRFNEATPDSDRIPCYNDIVKFPADAKITVTLPSLTQHVKGLNIGNESYTSADFKTRIQYETDQRQQFVLNDFDDTGILINTHMSCPDFGCPCQIVPLKIDCSVKFCPKPACVDPIKPLGFCCEICGGYIVFDADKGFDMLTFSHFVDQYTTDNVAVHIGYAPETPIRRIQLVIVDKGGYEGSSSEVINSINYDMKNHWFKGPKLAEISGSPLSKSGMGGIIFTTVFFIVAFTFGGFYMYYYKLPGLQFPVAPASGTRGVFSRFQTRSDSVVSLTRRDSVVSTARGATAFRNPMYNSKRGRVQVTETAVEE